MAEGSMPTWRGRPKLGISVTGIERTLIALSWVGVAVTVLGTLIALHYLPATLPLYMISESRSDGYGGTKLLLIFPGIALLFNLIYALLSRIPAYRMTYHIQITSQNAERQYHLFKDYFYSVRLLIVWMLVLINMRIIYCAFNGKLEPYLGPNMTITIGLIYFIAFAVILVYIMKANKER